MEFEFVLTKYNYESFIPQVSKALEKRTELISRKRCPKMWKYTDSLSSRDKAKEEKLKKRRKRYKVYGIFLILIGLFLLIPSLMKPEELLMPLFTGAFATGLGLLYFLYGRNRKSMKNNDRIYSMSFAKVYPMYVQKAEKKGRTKEEVDEIIRWLTGYSQEELETQLEKQVDFATFFKEAPLMNPARSLITGVICGVRVEQIEEPLMREIRYLDKLIDELAKGKAMDKILRK